MEIINLSNGYIAFVDNEDFELVSQYAWYGRSKTKQDICYAQTSIYKNGKRSTIDMHRLIVPDVIMIDHINRNGLDNQRKNLRSATQSQNRGNSKVPVNNTSGYKGVVAMPSGRWQARIASTSLGLYATKEEAALVYNVAAVERYGEFAYLNVL